MNSPKAFANFLRVVAAAIFLVALLPLVLSRGQLGADPRLMLWTEFVIALGAVAALLGIALLLLRKNTAPPEIHASLARIQQQVMEVDQKLKDVALMSDRAARASHPIATPLERDYSVNFMQLSNALDELREIVLLPDVDRRDRLVAQREQRRAVMLKDLFGLVAAHEWPKAERLLITLETDFPNDNEIAKGRSYLDHSRKLFEEETLVRSSREIEELVTAAAWDQALTKAELLVAGFPTNGDARTLLSRVQRECEIHRETTVQRMFEEIRHDIDRRIWGRALMHAERLMELFPTHRLADVVRAQVITLQENAEIQERQEMEVRIQELIRERHFEDAIELAEDVMRRFPMSPLAESLEKLLPRIRELSAEDIEQANTPQ